MAQRALELDPEYVAPNSPNGYFFLAGAMLQQGRSLDALASIRRPIRLDPRRSTARAGIYYLTGRPAEAVKIWERERAANPDSTPARARLVLYYVSVDRLEEARTIAPEIIAINPDLTAEWLATNGLFSQEEVPAGIASLQAAGLP